MLDLEDIRPGTIRSIRRLEYDRLVAMGLFVGENLELLRGQLVTMSPEGWLHSELVAWFNEYLIRSLDPSFSVRPGLPFAVSDDSEPQPDIFVGRKEPGRREHPSSTLLLIEVSDSSIRRSQDQARAVRRGGCARVLDRRHHRRRRAGRRGLHGASPHRLRKAPAAAQW